MDTPLSVLLTLCSYVMIKGSFGTVQMVACVAGLDEVFIQISNVSLKHVHNVHWNEPEKIED